MPWKRPSRLPLGILVMMMTHLSLSGEIRKVLDYKKVAGYYYRTAVPGCDSALISLSQEHGFSLKISEDVADILNIQDYDAVVYNNNDDAGDATPTEAAKESLRKYVEDGGSWIGFFASAASQNNAWKWYNDVLFSGKRATGWGKGYITLAVDQDLVADSALSRMWKDAGFKDTITFITEYRDYSDELNIRNDPDVKVLQRIVRADGPVSKDYIFTWTKRIGKGHMLYTGLGHGIPPPQLGKFPNDWLQNDAWLKKATWYWMKYLNGHYDQPSSASLGSERRRGWRESMTETGRVELYDLKGHRVAARTGMITTGPDFSNLAKPGLYFARIASPSGVTTLKIVIP